MKSVLRITITTLSVVTAMISMSVTVTDPAAAAGRFSLGLLGGLGLPEKSLIDASAPVEGVGDNPPDNFVYVKQRSSVAFGVRADYWLTPRAGVEAEVALLSSKGDLRAAFFDPADGSVQFGVLDESAKATYFGFLVNYAVIQPALDPLKVYLSAGVGAVHRSGKLFTELLEIKTGTDIGFVGGVGLQYSVGPGLAFRTDLRDYVTSYDPEVPDTGSFYKSKTQHDLMLSVGLDFILMK